MKIFAVFSVPLLFAVGACTTTATIDAEIPRLPTDAPKTVFSFKTESLLRGVNGAYNSIPKARSAAILDVTYTLECLAGGKPSAKQNFAKAKNSLEETYKIAPIYYNNPRERGAWNRSAKRLIIKDNVCQVTGVRDEVQTTDQRKVLLFVLQNRLLPVN